MTDLEKNGHEDFTKRKDKEYNYCLRCGRRLISPENRARGMGKVCWEKSRHEPKNRIRMALTEVHK